LDCIAADNEIAELPIFGFSSLLTELFRAPLPVLGWLAFKEGIVAILGFNEFFYMVRGLQED